MGMNEMMIKKYETPSVVKTVDVCLENDLLAGSVVNKKTKISTAGQQVETKDFSETGFNSTGE